MVTGLTTQTDNDTLEKYCYDNDPLNCTLYGGLYQWDEAMQYSAAEGGQGICPTGWHVPTLAELQVLSMKYSGDGNVLKAIGQGTADGAGTNSSGLSTLLAGYRSNYGGYFFNLGSFASLWSSTEYSSADARSMNLFYDWNYIVLNGHNKTNGNCVRCLKD